MLNPIINQTIDSEHAFVIFKQFYNDNAGDEATTNMILNIFSELFDISPDMLLELLHNT